MNGGIDGFLGTRASLMLDVVVLGMVAFLAIMGLSIYLMKYRRKYALHKRIQVSLAVALLIIIGLFETDMRLHGWTHRAEASRYWGAEGQWGLVKPAIMVHLFFAVTTAILWVVVAVQALRKFPVPPKPGQHSQFHLRWARLAAIDMCLTTLTGWIFYWLAFVA